MAEFEVAIYNKSVRERVAEGERHRQLADDWADVHYIDVEAVTEEAARNQIARKYPPSQGFVIENVAQSIF